MVRLVLMAVAIMLAFFALVVATVSGMPEMSDAETGRTLAMVLSAASLALAFIAGRMNP